MSFLSLLHELHLLHGLTPSVSTWALLGVLGPPLLSPLELVHLLVLL